MLNNTKQIEVKGKKYTLTVKRSILFKIAQICPEAIKIAKVAKNKNGGQLTDEDIENCLGNDCAMEAVSKLYDNMPILFYELIKVAHKDISMETSDKIYWDFYDEYNDVDEHLYDFIQSVFMNGIPKEKKKNLDW